MIRLESLTKRWDNGQVAVDALDLDIGEGEICVLVGPSGCGKTTTLKMVNRLIEPSSGRIFLGGDDVTDVDPVELRRRIGYVIQQVGLFPHLTVADNVATVPRLLKWDKTRVRKRVNELPGLVGRDPAQFGRRYPHQLSGGQRQRVGVARALGVDPPTRPPAAGPRGWGGPGPPASPRRSCSWTSPSGPSTPSPGTGCKGSS